MRGSCGRFGDSFKRLSTPNCRILAAASSREIEMPTMMSFWMERRYYQRRLGWGGFISLACALQQLPQLHSRLNLKPIVFFFRILLTGCKTAREVLMAAYKDTRGRLRQGLCGDTELSTPDQTVTLVTGHRSTRWCVAG